ncbi:MAG TPA: hypothetical protein VH302_13415 [Bryobacteraceae bacterium]|nr:hypothetical protein [Bryobacteraceae bacterium]
MANLSKTTQDHEEIQRWAEERGGKPSHVKGTGHGDDVGILRIDFPGYSGEGSLEEISWDQWFDKFDERNLALLYEEETAGGQRSNFNKIVTAETAAANERGDHRKAGGSKRSSDRGGSSSAGRSGGGGSAKKKSGAKAAGKKSGAGASAKKSSAPAKKGPIKKAAAKKAPAKKAAAKKSGGSSVKKAPAKKTATKKAAANKSTAKKSGATKKSAAGKHTRR